MKSVRGSDHHRYSGTWNDGSSFLTHGFTTADERSIANGALTPNLLSQLEALTIISAYISLVKANYVVTLTRKEESNTILSYSM